MAQPFKRRPQSNARGMSSPQGVADQQTRQLIEEMQQAINELSAQNATLRRELTSIQQADPSNDSVMVMAPRLELNGNKLRVFEQQIKLQGGRLIREPERLKKTIVLPEGGTTTVVAGGGGTSTTTIYYVVPRHSHGGYSDGGYGGHFSGSL